MNEFLIKFYDLVDKVMWIVQEELCLSCEAVQLKPLEDLENSGLICKENAQSSEINHELLENVEYVLQKHQIEDYYTGELAIRIKDTDFCVYILYST